MNAKTLTVLAALTVVVAGLAFVGSRQREEAKTAAGAPSGPLYPGLLERVNDVAAIEIAGADGELVVERAEQGWGLASKGGYPVDFEDVKTVVMAVAQMEVLEPRTSKPERYAKLGVQDPGAPDARSSRVTLRDAGGAVLADLIVGIAKYDLGTEALYVRRAGEDQSWLVSGRLTVSSRPKTWLEAEILRLDRERVASAVVEHPDGETLRISRPDGQATEWDVPDVPDGRELTSASAPSSLGTALTWVALDDVAPADSIDFEGATRTEFTTFDGLVVTVHTVERDGTHWTRYAARFDPERAAEPEEPEPEPGNGGAETIDIEPPAADEEPERDVAAEAEELNGRLAGWAFAVPPYKAQSFTRRMEDLLQDVVLPADEPPPVDAEPADAEPTDAEPVDEEPAGAEEPATPEPDAEPVLEAPIAGDADGR